MAKCEAERNRFGHVCWRNDHKCEKFKIAKCMNKANQDTTGQQSGPILDHFWEEYFAKNIFIRNGQKRHAKRDMCLGDASK